MKLISIIISLIFCSLIPAQAQISIEDCYDKARANYPLIRQYDLIEKSKDYNLSNASKGYLPQFQISAKATYQSEVTKIPVSIPDINIEGLSKDQYSATIELNQTIWDGGVIGSKRKSIKTQSEVDQRNLDVTLYSINERVNQLYFGILLHDGMLEQNRLYQEELQRNYNQISSYIQNGIANQSDLDAVKVEQLKAIQTDIQLRHDRKAYLDILSALIGEKLDENIVLQKPDKIIYVSHNIQRPELSLFSAQYNNLDAMKKEIKSTGMPKLGLFITGGYGRPGLNMLDPDFSAYYMGGVRLTWNFGNFYTQKNNIKLLETNRNSIQTQYDAFMLNTNIDITKKNSEIDKLQQILQSDDEIISLRVSVKQSAEAKVASGTMSVTDLMREINSEQLARQDKILHDLQLMQAFYNMKYITNN